MAGYLAAGAVLGADFTVPIAAKTLLLVAFLIATWLAIAWGIRKVRQTAEHLAAPSMARRQIGGRGIQCLASHANRNVRSRAFHMNPIQNQKEKHAK